MKKLFIIAVLFLGLNCGNENHDLGEKSIANLNDTNNPSVKEDKQLNINILLDLSDRLVQNLTPSQTERDLEIVSSILNIFKSDMERKGAFASKGKVKIFFHPSPDDTEINNIAENLSVDLTLLDNKQKKIVHDNIEEEFKTNLKKIYELTLKKNQWIGSDIWRFFKNDVKDYCVEDDIRYRNILIIFTDGYIYHTQSRDRVKNRTAYITSEFFNQEGFRHNPKWMEKFNNGDYGLIPNGEDLSRLEILVLEINPFSAHVNDEDIIKTYLKKWFKEMNVQRYSIYNTDLPSNTKKRLVDFFKN